MAAFRAADRAGFSTYRAGRIRGHAIEVFPHASATVFAGCLPPARQTTTVKRAWRAGVLRAQHVPTSQLRTLDQIDAALAALTGIVALELGDPFAPGVPEEGRIVLPARVVPAAGYRRCAPAAASASNGSATEPLIRFCACGCGAQTRPGSEFRSGHDRKLMVELRARGRRRRPRSRRARATGVDVSEKHLETAAIHAGQDPDAPYGAVSVPIYQNSTYAQDDVAAPKVWDYGRGGNPTREAFQQALAAVEGGDRCFAFGSGMGAETTLLLTLRPGDHVLLADDVYGGTYRLLSKVLGPWGLELSTCDLGDLDAMAAALRPIDTLRLGSRPRRTRC